MTVPPSPYGLTEDAVPQDAAAAPAAARQGRSAWTAPLTTGAVVAAATLVVAIVDPHHPGSFGVCPLLVLTGFACPGCGGLRATYDLAHLDLAGAWALNPLWVVTAPLVVAFWGVWLARAARGRRAPRVQPALLWAGLGVIALFGVLRNVPALTPWLGSAV